jgi:hypothetical protein
VCARVVMADSSCGTAMHCAAVLMPDGPAVCWYPMLGAYLPAPVPLRAWRVYIAFGE